jgi:hypothetical protein
MCSSCLPKRGIWSVNFFQEIIFKWLYIQVCPRIRWFSICCLPRPEKKFENYRNKQFISSKTRTKREWAITWSNPTAQTHPLLDSSPFTPILTLSRRTCLHSASSVLAVRISCRVITVFVFRKPWFINKLYRIYVCYTNITSYIAFGIIRGFT